MKFTCEVDSEKGWQDALGMSDKADAELGGRERLKYRKRFSKFQNIKKINNFSLIAIFLSLQY